MCQNGVNKLMALSMTMLCSCWAVFFWNVFDTAWECKDNMDVDLCQAVTAGGSLSVIAALIGLGGGFYASFQKNQAHMSAALSLLNLSVCTIMWVMVKYTDNETYEEIKSGEVDTSDLEDIGKNLWIIVGFLHFMGFLFGVVYFLCLRCELACLESWQMSKSKNNFCYVAAMFFYLVAQGVLEYKKLELADCSTDPDELSKSVQDELDKQMDGDHDATNRCVSYAFAGSFLIIGALACMVALILAFFQEAARQGRIQQGSLAFSIGMACLAQTSVYWFEYTSGPCKDEDPFETRVCTGYAFGGIFSVIGFPLALFTSFGFLCGCFDESASESVVVVAGGRNKGVINV